MLRKIFHRGKEAAVPVPLEFLSKLELEVGSQVRVELDRENNQILVRPEAIDMDALGVDDRFAARVDGFIERYQVALEALKSL